MSLINSDIKIYGKHGVILRSLEESSLFDSHAEGFVLAALIGLYHGRKAEPESTSDNETNVSRVYFSRRPDLEIILFTYLQHEKLYQGRALRASEVFLYEEHIDDEVNLIEELKQYAYYGIEYLGKEYSQILSSTSTDTVIDSIIDENLLNPEALEEKVVEDEKYLFYKSFEDEDVSSELNELMSLYKEG